MPKVSIIVPVYKAEKYVSACIESIRIQTFSDWELILVDDGSPDNGLAICREYAKMDPRITVFHQENQGQAAARNHGLRSSTGQWICFVDSDDVIHPQMVELLYQAAVEGGADISMCRYVELPELPEAFFRPVQLQYELLPMDEEGLAALYDRDEYPGWIGCTKLVRREIVEEYPFTEGRIFEDNEAVSRWICRTKYIADIDQVLYYYRTNLDSTTKSTFSLKKLDYLWALESITRHYGLLGYEQMRQRFFRRYADAAINACYGLRCELGREDLARETSKRAKAFSREQRIPLRVSEKEALLDAAYPKLIRFYWPVAGILRRLGLYKGGSQ